MRAAHGLARMGFFCAGACLLVAAPKAHGITEALSALPDSAKASAMVGGRFATLDDASALRTSPANLLQLKEPEAQANLGLWVSDVVYRSFDGEEIKLQNENTWLPSFYYVQPLEAGQSAVGLGIQVPSGIGFEYPRNTRWKYLLAYESQIANLAINPALAYRVHPRVAVGAGLEFLYSTLNTKQDYPFAALVGAPVPDGVLDFEADGWGYGGFLGATVDLPRNQRVSLTGRLPVQVDYSGDLKISNFPPGLQAIGLSQKSDFETDIEFAGAVSTGYAIDLLEDLTWAVDFEWANSSTHDDIPADIGNNQPLLGGATRTVLDWKDNYSYGTGAEWRQSERLSLRAGYHYTDTALRDFTYTPAVSSNNRHIFSAGAGLALGETKRHVVDFAYSYIHFEDRTIARNQVPAFEGNYTYDWNIFTLSYRHKF